MKPYGRPVKEGVRLKKKYGQHFLTDTSILTKIVSSVAIDPSSKIFEIGGGQGALTRAILASDCNQLHVFEIDEEWAVYLKQQIKDQRLVVHHENILDVPRSFFEPDDKWILLANLPYQVTFPILHLLKRNADLLQEGVIMVQEEVAQRIVATKGRDYGFVSVYFQWFFDWKLMDKIAPGAFYPPPNVYSRLLHFKPNMHREQIPAEDKFWKMLQAAFKQPRRTLKNNLQSLHYSLEKVPEELLQLRAQQMTLRQFLDLWRLLQST